MAAKRFRSKVDRWILVLLLMVIVAQLVIIVGVAMDDEEPIVTTGVILACLLVMVLIGWLLIGTHYTVNRGVLKIASGPFRWTVPVEQITMVEATRNPLSSPALSLDRLRIRYGHGRRILISPADQRGFLRAIGHSLETAAASDE